VKINWEIFKTEDIKIEKNKIILWNNESTFDINELFSWNLEDKIELDEDLRIKFKNLAEKYSDLDMPTYWWKSRNIIKLKDMWEWKYFWMVEVGEIKQQKNWK
jgi:hypothetical protein